METVVLLFSLLRCAVCSEELNEEAKRASASREALEKVYALAQKHGVAHLAAHALETLDLPECEGLAKLRKAKTVAIYRYIQQDHEFEKIRRTLEVAQIPFIPLKGSVLRQYYPQPWMRNSCDIDILIQETHLEKAVLQLEQTCGYHRKGKGHHDVSLYASNGVHLELHYQLVETAVPEKAQRILQDVWERSEVLSASGYERCMPGDFFYFYHMAHMAKHFIQGGCGIRSFLDLWVMDRMEIAKKAECDAILEYGELKRFSEASQQLAKCWFSNEPMYVDTKRFSDCVLRGGIYGSLENRVVIGKVSEKSTNIPLTRLVIPYKDLRYSYPVLDKSPWLLPICQVLRWFRLLGVHGRLLKKRTEIRSASQETDMEMRLLLQDLGLRKRK